MKKVWNIYLNNYQIGYCKKLNEVFKFVEAKVGKKLTNWNTSKDRVKVFHCEDEYEAKKECLN